MRNLLERLIDSEFNIPTFDLSHEENIDSISYSKIF